MLSVLKIIDLQSFTGAFQGSKPDGDDQRRGGSYEATARLPRYHGRFWRGESNDGASVRTISGTFCLV